MERVVIKNFCAPELTPIIIQELPKAINAIIDSEIKRGITIQLPSGEEIYIKRRAQDDILFDIYEVKKSFWSFMGFVNKKKTKTSPGIMSLNISVK
jgi:hypothetical protein